MWHDMRRVTWHVTWKVIRHVRSDKRNTGMSFKDVCNCKNLVHILQLICNKINLCTVFFCTADPSDRWQGTSDEWRVTCYEWRVTSDLRRVTWHLTSKHDMWQVTWHVSWHVTCHGTSDKRNSVYMSFKYVSSFAKILCIFCNYLINNKINMCTVFFLCIGDPSDKLPVYGGTWIGVACWWYLPSCMNQRDVPMPRVDRVGVTNMWGRYPHN
jgi:hypothetical protein